MKLFTLPRVLGLGIAAAVLAAGLTGCAHHSSVSPQMLKAGAEMQSRGLMTQSDYVRVDTLEHSVTNTHMISDTDLDWTLSLLKNANNGIARARAMTALSEIRPMSAAQKAKIVPAITPYLHSSNRLDQLGAQRVQKAIQVSN